MALVIVIDLIAVIGLVYMAASRRGLEDSLPLASFLIVSVPLESLLPAGFFTITTHRVIVGVLLLLYFTRAASADPEARRSAAPLKTLLVINAVWYLFATVNSIVLMNSIKKAISVLLEYYVIYFTYVKTISRVETVQRILLAIVFGLVICCLFGVPEATQGWSVLALFPSMEHHWEASYLDRDARIESTYDHAILYGTALAMSIIVTLYLMSVVTRGWQKVVLWVGLGLMFYNLYKTTSRGPWLDTMMGAVLLIVFGNAKVRRALLYLVAVSVLAVVVRPGVWGTIEGLYENTFSTDSSTGASYEYRHALPAAAVHRMSTGSFPRLLWGYGPESFWDVRLEGELVGKPHVFLSCDNSWVQFLIETGVVGLGIMVLLLIQPAWAAWKQFRIQRQHGRYLSLTIFIVFVMWYFQMYSVSMYAWGQTGYTLWIFIALTYSYGRIMRRPATFPDSSGVTVASRAAVSADGWLVGGEATPAWRWAGAGETESWLTDKQDVAALE